MILNAMDPYLDSRELHIFLSSASLFLEAARNLRGEETATSSLIGDFAARVRPQVVRFMKPCSKPKYHESQVGECVSYTVCTE